MTEYIYLDNWVLSRLSNRNFFDRLSTFIDDNRLSIILTSALLGELYNPGWKTAKFVERGDNTAKFLSQHSCVIVDPKKLFQLEYENFPSLLKEIPINFDLNIFTEDIRYETLLRLLRRDKLFLDQGKDISQWQIGMKEHKLSWISSVGEIIKNAVKNEYLKQDEKGSYYCKKENKELFLLSLDMRLIDNCDLDSLIMRMRSIKTNKGILFLRGIRVTSLCFYYTYVSIDPTNRPKQKGSDIVDIYHFGLIPYCKIFTVDSGMYKIFSKVSKDIDISNCKLLSPQLLEELINYKQ